MSRRKDLNKIKHIQKVVASLFAKKGYRSVSMREIASALSMRPSSLYHYFDGKEALLFKIMDSAMEESLAVLKDMSTSEKPTKERLEAMLHFYSQYYLQESERLTLLVNEIPSLSSQYRSKLVEREKEFVNLFRNLIQELINVGEIRSLDATSAVFSFFGMIHYTVKWYDPQGRITPAELSRQIVRIFTKGLYGKD